MVRKINTDIIKVTPEMEGRFLAYLHRHQRAVAQYARKLFKRGLISRGLMRDISTFHDMSKTEEPEFTPYVKRKWFEREGSPELYKKMGDDVKQAIVHHVTTNSHHPEYWSDDYRGFDTNAPCHVNDMPNDCVVEMICDWMAMGDERGNTAEEWYEKVRDTRWIFDRATNIRILNWLETFKNIENGI